MSNLRSLLLALLLVITLVAAAAAAPRKGAVPALPPLNGAAPAAPAAATDTPSAPAAPAPAGPGPMALYSGQAADDAGLTLLPWGGGAAVEDTVLSLDNGHSIQVTTVDEYQGGRIIFRTPVSLGEMSTTRFLQMSLHFPKVAVQPALDNGGFGRRGRFGRGRRGGPGAFGGPGGTAAPPVEESPTPLVTALRWVLTLADGRRTEVRRPLPETATSGQSWFTLAVPLSALKFPAGSASPLQSLTIAADGYSQLSVGAIQIVSDATPITVSLNRPQDGYAGQPIVFHATADAGPSALRYAWNFGTGDSTDEQAEGQTVQMQYYTPGTYTITLTVSDRDGIKKSETKTVTVHVR